MLSFGGNPRHKRLYEFSSPRAEKNNLRYEKTNFGILIDGTDLMGLGTIENLCNKKIMSDRK